MIMYCTTSQKLACWMGMTVDNRLTWVPHVLDPKKSFVNKLELLNILGFHLKMSYKNSTSV